MSEPEEPSGPEEEPGNGHDAGDLLDELSGSLDDDDDLGELPGPLDDDDDLDVLSSPLGNDDELNAVLTRRPRAKLPSLTLALAALVVASAGFLGGILVGKHYGSSGSGSAASAFSRFAAGASATAGTRSGLGAGLGGRTGGGGGFATGNATIGTIKLIDAGTVYVQTVEGDIVQVSTSAGTKVTVSSTVPIKDLQPGETVIVEGSKNSRGGVTATSISQTSLGAGFGG
jgi:hypothetical protein